MKALSYIVVPIILICNSCASTLYTGAENDDLYYSASDKPAVKEKAVVNNQVAEKELKANNYYDNVYAADTLVSDKYSVPSDYDDQIVVNNNNISGGSGYDYSDDSYSGRLNMFYGNYFNPYWQDPFYLSYGFNYGYPYFGMGMNFGFGFGYGYPYYGYGYNPYYWDTYGYYGGYWGYPYYGGGYYPYYPSDGGHGTAYGRRERPSSMSSRYNNSLATAGGRRGNDLTGGGYTSGGRRSAPVSQGQSATADARRATTGAAVGKSAQDVTSRSASSTQRSQTNTRPDYRSANRTYTPSYNNPRMSTRPSYNNSRVSDGSGSSVSRGSSNVGSTRNFSNTAPVRSSQNRAFNQNSGSTQRSNSFSNTHRYSSPSGSSGQYSMPSRRSAESGGTRSSSSSRSFSSPSYSGGGSSSGSYSRSSYSGGGSSSGSSGRSSSSSSSSSHSSGGRR